MRSFHRALAGFNNFWIHFIFIIYFNCVSISKIPSPPLQMESLARLTYVPFSISFLIYFDQNTNLVYVSKLGEKGLVVCDYLFTSQRESHSVPDRDFFCSTITYFVPFGVIKNRVTKINFKYFNGNCDYSSCRGWSILFLYASSHQALAVRKNNLLN